MALPWGYGKTGSWKSLFEAAMMMQRLVTVLKQRLVTVVKQRLLTVVNLNIFIYKIYYMY